jgi:hypothetical protein
MYYPLPALLALAATLAALVSRVGAGPSMELGPALTTTVGERRRPHLHRPPPPLSEAAPSAAAAPAAAGGGSSYYDVLIVPHSHCDAGYKKTVEGYYLTEVKRVLDSVVAALVADGSLRFAWAESAYLWRWWQVGVGEEGGTGLGGGGGLIVHQLRNKVYLIIISPNHPHPIITKTRHILIIIPTPPTTPTIPTNRTPRPGSGRRFTPWFARGGWSW